MWATGMVFAALLGFVVVQKQTYKAEADRLLAQLRAAGDPITLPELAAEYNRFRTPTNPAATYEELFASLPKNAPSPSDFGLSGEHWPAPSVELPPHAVEAMRAFVSTNQPVYDKIAELSSNGVAVFDLEFLDGPNTLLPHLSKVKLCTQMLQVRAFVEIADGNRAAAVQTTIQSLNLLESLKAEPFLISQLVRNAMYHFALLSLERLLVQHELLPNEIEALEAALNQAPTLREFQHSLKGERAIGLSIFEKPSTLEPGAKSMADLKALPAWEADRLRYITRLTAIINLATNDYLEAVSEIDRLQHEMLARRAFEKSVPLKAALGFLWQARPLTGALLPSLFNVPQRQADTIAKTRLARIALALEKKGAGYSQKSVKDLAEFLPTNNLIDPFTGQFFLLRQLNDGVLLYSVGADGQDHQGTRTGEMITRRRGGGANTNAATRPRAAKAGETDIVFQVK